MAKSMLEKLTEHFESMKRLNNDKENIWGHVIGFYREPGETVMEYHRFPSGMFRIRNINGDFIYWDYNPDH